MRYVCRVLFVAVVSATLIGCSSSSSPSSTGSTLNMMMTDSPFTDGKALLVTFSEVSAHMSGAGDFTTLPFSGGGTSRTCDLKKLMNGAQDVLGAGTLTAGHYTQVRLTVSSATIYFDNASSGSACAPSIPAPGGASASVTIPSGQVILNREFDVTATGATTMTLDFNGDQSVHALGNGQYSMSPVIAVLSVQ